jgi:hypothetical protein
MSYKRGHLDNLYLVVDQQNRWKSELLPVPASALLDPLLIGEKRERSRSSQLPKASHPAIASMRLSKNN